MTKNRMKSLGALRIQQKTKPRSPEMTGTIRIQRHTLETIIEQMDDDAEVVASLAAWKHRDGDECYLSVELSPKYQGVAKLPQQARERTIFDYMDDE